MCATAAVLVPDACTANTYNLWQRVMKRGGKIGEKEKEETRSGRKTERERERRREVEGETQRKRL